MINPLFMGVFMGTTASCLALTFMAISRWNQPGTALLLAGCLLYLVGTFGVTIGGNVPLNDALAAVKPETPEGAHVWANYLNNWTLWNHIRTVAALAATASCVLALRYPAP